MRIFEQVCDSDIPKPAKHSGGTNFGQVGSTDIL